jgi:hypothetical protein
VVAARPLKRIVGPPLRRRESLRGAPTRSDCLFGVWRLVEKSMHSQWYRKPYGCMYVGSQNPYVLYIINFRER